MRGDFPRLHARGSRRLSALPTDTRRRDQWPSGPDRQELALPSGKTVIVQRPDLPRLIRRGGVPADLLAAVEHHAVHGTEAALAVIAGTGGELAPGERLSVLAGFMAFVDALAVAAVADPPLSFDGRAGTVQVSRLADADRLHIWRWASAQVCTGVLRPGVAKRGANE